MYCSFVIFSAFLTIGCGDKPPLRLKQADGKVYIDVQTLGEYQTTVARIRLTDGATDNVLWELQAAGGIPQIHGFALAGGRNSVVLRDVASGTYEVVVPIGRDFFELTTERKYRLQIWGSDLNEVPAETEIILR
jgi:hypothetical protein